MKITDAEIKRLAMMSDRALSEHFSNNSKTLDFTTIIKKARALETGAMISGDPLSAQRFENVIDAAAMWSTVITYPQALISTQNLYV